MVKILIICLICFATNLWAGPDDPTVTQLQAAYDYLFTPEEQEAYSNLGDNPFAQNRYWHSYWKKNDPTPKTPNYNENLDLFQRRLSLSSNFISQYEFDEGWRTDQGKVFIFFGAPLEIHRSPYGPTAIEKKEVWVYVGRDAAGKEMRVELLFVDEDDSGEFFLETEIDFPTIISEDNKIPELIKE